MAFGSQSLPVRLLAILSVAVGTSGRGTMRRQTDAAMVGEVSARGGTVVRAALHGPVSDKELPQMLLQAKEECLTGQVACLPTLTKLRRAIWPRIQAETKWQGAAFFPREIDGEEFIGELHKPCAGAQSVYYRHVWKAAGQTIFRNLERMSRPVLQAGLRYPEFCQDYLADRRMKKPGISFTFVRDPLARFFSGYAEIEHRLADGFPDYLHLREFLLPFARGTRARGKAFFEAFLRNAINHDGHVKPQSEFLAALGNCGVPTDFVGKTESFDQDWARLVATLGCPAAPFDGSLGLHPNDFHDKDALRHGIGVSLFKLNASEDAANLQRQMHSMALTAALADDDGAYLRGLCWLLLPDYVIFDYELPDGCRRGNLRDIHAAARALRLASLGPAAAAEAPLARAFGPQIEALTKRAAASAERSEMAQSPRKASRGVAERRPPSRSIEIAETTTAPLAAEHAPSRMEARRKVARQLRQKALEERLKRSQAEDARRAAARKAAQVAKPSLQGPAAAR